MKVMRSTLSSVVSNILTNNFEEKLIFNQNKKSSNQWPYMDELFASW